MLNSAINFAKINFYRILAAYQSKETYPESIDLSLDELISKPRDIKITIIDDDDFPWIDAVNNRGCSITHYSDYTKPIVQSNQKIKTISASSSDIIICDINGVGSSIYPGLDGVGVIEELRRLHPFHVIIAYTGNPGAIHAKLKNQKILDGIMVRDWGIDDFLFNLDEYLKIYKIPANRWKFINERLKHLGLKDKDINNLRMKFVENIIFSKYIKEKLKFSPENTKKLLTKEDNIDIGALARFGVTAAQASKLLSPLVLSLGEK